MVIEVYLAGIQSQAKWDCLTNAYLGMSSYVILYAETLYSLVNTMAVVREDRSLKLIGVCTTLGKS